MKVNLKVVVNKRNGQLNVSLPKKMFANIPKEVQLDIPTKNVSLIKKRRIW